MAGEARGIEIEGRAVLRVSSMSRRITLVAEDRSDVLVARGSATVDPSEPDRVRIDGGSDRVEARVPTGTDVVIGAGSGRIELVGQFGSVSVTAGSARVEIDRAAQVDLRTVSGRVEIGGCEGMCRINAGSGRIEIGSTGPADVIVASGAIEIREIRGASRLKTVSGRIEATLGGAHDVDAESVSGRIAVYVPPDVRPDVTLQSRGRTACTVGTGTAPTVRAKSVSGRLEVMPSRGGRRR